MTAEASREPLSGFRVGITSARKVEELTGLLASADLVANIALAI